ncbi:hypothetical protein [Bordetella bronchialis]|uniref:Replication protein n=1 Tax=Bordetella bronchialis TaxID=463025 RepID=A0ABN4QZ57_9BORD|nr:hypothetical protein [Bordetella bronchialis]ANN66313.1 hypothetical protein BAU06_08440 [Bordetella bronchialis]
MSTVSIPPVSPQLPFLVTPVPSSPQQESSAQAPGSGTHHAGRAAAVTFERHETSTAQDPALPPVDIGSTAPSALGIETIPPTRVLDTRAIIDRVAGEWEKAGVDAAWIKAIKSPDSWMTLTPADRPAITKLGEALQRTGEFSAMRSQAIRILRGTQVWETALNDRQRANPGIPRWRLDHQMVAEQFGWRQGASHEHARTLQLIVGALDLAAGAAVAESRQPAPTSTRV